MLKLLFVATLLIVLSACGGEAKKDDATGHSIPGSVVTAADLEPGSVVDLDASALKLAMESGGEGGFDHNQPADGAGEQVGTCFQKKFDSLKVKAVDSTVTMTGEIEYGDCLESSFRESEMFKDADFSGMTARMTTKFSLYMHCEGVNLGKYDGKSFSDLSVVAECNQAKSIRLKSESVSSESMSGTIKGVDYGDGKKDYEIEDRSTHLSVTRSDTGDVCVAKVEAGVIRWEDGCVSISKGLQTKGRRGFAGEVTNDENVGKATYQKIVYRGLTANADSTSRWYTGGGFDVTLNSWNGTVSYSDATTEPVFTMTDGNRTVTGRIKGEAPDMSDLLLSGIR